MELVDERNATEEIRFFNYRILFVDGTTHWTYTAYGARDVLEVQDWVQEQVHGLPYAIFLEPRTLRTLRRLPWSAFPGATLKRANTDGLAH